METPETIAEFIAFLETQLIPDIEELSYSETARDFERCIRIIRQLQGE